ncbi:ATP-dependent DNA helicase sgs1 [Tulasnella sp. 427]|nr:ATP-dependent DNA helicase sgs1 [Tulasnella sp. 427]
MVDEEVDEAIDIMETEDSEDGQGAAIEPLTELAGPIPQVHRSGVRWRPELEPYRLRVYAGDGFKLLICQECKWAIEPAARAVALHLGQKCKAKGTAKLHGLDVTEQGLRRALQAVSNELIGHDVFKELYPLHFKKTHQLPSAIEGIPLQDGFYITRTGECSTSRAVLNSSNAAFERMLKSGEIERCKIQRIFYLQTKWRVNSSELHKDPAPLDPQAELAKVLAGLTLSEEQWATPANRNAAPGDVHPFHRDTGWQDWRRGLSLDEESALSDATSFTPASNPFHHYLLCAVEAYMGTVLSTCSPANRVVREQINQSRRHSGKRVKPFGPLFAEASLKTYARVLGRLLLFAMNVALADHQNGALSQVSLTTSQLREATRLWDALQSGFSSWTSVHGDINDANDVDDGEEWWGDQDDDDTLGDTADLGEDDPPYSSPLVACQSSISKEVVELIHSLARALFLHTHDIADNATSHPAATLVMFWSKTPNGEVRPARQISSFLVKIQYSVRLTVYSQVIHSARLHELDLEMALDRLRHWTDEGEKTIFRWIRHSIALAAKSCIHDIRLPNILPLNAEGTEWSYRGQTLSLRDYKSYCASISASCWGELEKLLDGIEWQDLLDKLQTRDDGKALQDDVSCEATGYSIFEDTSNGVGDLWKVLLGRMLGTGRFHSYAINDQSGNRELCWNVAAVRNWLDQADRLCKALHLACFESFAAPPRSTEYNSALFRNMPGRVRNIYKINDVLTFILKYNKTSSQTGMDNPIARALPFSLQLILSFYMGNIKPVGSVFVGNVLERSPEGSSKQLDIISTHLWSLHKGTLLNSDDLTLGMRKHIEPFVGQATAAVYGTRFNRHFKKALGRRCIENHPVVKAMDESSLSLFESQSGHSQAIASMFYARLGGPSFHPTISPRILRQHQILGQIMHGVFGFASPPSGNLDLEPPRPPEWVFHAVENLPELVQKLTIRNDASSSYPGLVEQQAQSLDQGGRLLEPETITIAQSFEDDWATPNRIIDPPVPTSNKANQYSALPKATMVDSTVVMQDLNGAALNNPESPPRVEPTGGIQHWTTAIELSTSGGSMTLPRQLALPLASLTATHVTGLSKQPVVEPSPQVIEDTEANADTDTEAAEAERASPLQEITNHGDLCGQASRSSTENSQLPKRGLGGKFIKAGPTKAQGSRRTRAEMEEEDVDDVSQQDQPITKQPRTTDGRFTSAGLAPISKPLPGEKELITADPLCNYTDSNH